MNKSTLTAALAAIMLVPCTGMAQLSKTQTALLKKAQTTLKTFWGKRSHAIKKTEENTDDMLPGTVKRYEYKKGNYEYQTTTDYTYDNLGNVLSSKEWSGNEGMVQILQYEYDKVETDFVTKVTGTTYETMSSTVPYYEYVSKRVDVTRNSKGQVTLVEDWEPNDTNTGLELDSKVTFEYGTDGKASKIAITEYDEESGNMTVTFSDIKWESYNGELLSIFGTGEVDNILFEPDNLIKSAKMEMTEGNITIGGNATGTYSETKSELTISLTMYGSIPVGEIVMSYEITDDNGSYISKNTSTIDGTETETEECVYNDNGDMTKETYSDGKDFESYEYSYSYNAATGLADYMLASAYNKSTKAYDPSYKLEYSNYVDVTTGISNATATTPGNGKTAIYNAHGIYMGKSFDSLHGGIYIVRQGGKSFKVIK